MCTVVAAHEGYIFHSTMDSI